MLDEARGPRHETASAVHASKPLYDHLFTVFTPTFNRAATLERVYESLKSQTLRDFEWLIVDDGSVDDTADLVRKWQQEADFPIRYTFQQNEGKHVAFNQGVRQARGELFLTFDSDDACVPQALERFKHHWESIPIRQRERFSAVTALCVDQHGRLIGSRFPYDVTDSNTLEIIYRYKVKGEKWGFQRTDVLRNYPFPEDIRRQIFPEGLIWSKIAREYHTRYVNEPLRTYFIDGPSLIHGQKPGSNAIGGTLENLAVLNDYIDFFRYSPIEFARSACLYIRFSLHCGTNLRTQARKLKNPIAWILWAACLPVGVLLYVKDQKRRHLAM
jgi:glycosyltransferase involved in cell wall biosynthesis